jgi:perosamine synthetase
MPINKREYLYFRGRVGLFHILQLLNVKCGDEIIVQAFTCVAVVEAVLATGATPIWVDIVPNGVNLDPGNLSKKITTKTKAIVVQHTFGIPADLDAILAIAELHQIAVIEDCCHIHGSTHRNRPLGTFGAAAFWSYEWGKPVVAGLGGEVKFNAASIQARARDSFDRSFRAPPAKSSFVNAVQYLMHSLFYGPRRFWMVRRAYRIFSRAGVAVPSFNPIGPDSPLSAEFGWQMCGFTRRRLGRARSKATALLPERKQQADRYASGIKATAARFVSSPSGAQTIYSRFPVFVSNKAEFLSAAYAANLEVAAFFSTVVHPLSGKELDYVGYVPGLCPLAEAAAASLVSFPLGPKVTPDFQDDVIDLVNRYARA